MPVVLKLVQVVDQKQYKNDLIFFKEEQYKKRSSKFQWNKIMD